MFAALSEGVNTQVAGYGGEILPSDRLWERGQNEPKPSEHAEMDWRARVSMRLRFFAMRT
jgi:hypothetical protein